MLLVVWICVAQEPAAARQERTSSEVVFESDRLEQSVVNGVITRILIGANFQQGDTYLRADRAR